MKIPSWIVLLAAVVGVALAGPTGNAQPRTRTKHLRPVFEKRQQFAQGQPVNAKGNGAPILGTLMSMNDSSELKQDFT